MTSHELSNPWRPFMVCPTTPKNERVAAASEGASERWFQCIPMTMSAMPCQSTGVSIVYSGADQRKHQSSTSLAFVMGIHRWSVDSPHKGPVTRKMFPFDDVIITKGWHHPVRGRARGDFNQPSAFPLDRRKSDTPQWTTCLHCDDVIMTTMASQITSPTVVYSTVYSDADQRKHQSPASLALCVGNSPGPVNSPHKWPVTRKMFPFDDVIMWAQH